MIDKYGWHSLFYIGGSLLFALLPFLLIALPESVRYLALKGKKSEVAKLLAVLDRSKHFSEDDEFILYEPKLRRNDVRALFGNRLASGTLLLWITIFSSLVLTYGLINWIPSLLIQKGLSTQDAVMGTVTLNFAGIAGSLVFSLLMNNKRHAPVTAGAAYVLGAFAVASIGMVSGSFGSMMISIGAAGFFIIGAQVAVSAYATAFYPTAIRGTGTGYFQMAGRSGSLVGPLVAGLVLAAGSGPIEIFRMGAIPALTAAIALFAFVYLRCEQKAHDGKSHQGLSRDVQ